MREIKRNSEIKDYSTVVEIEMDDFILKGFNQCKTKKPKFKGLKIKDTLENISNWLFKEGEKSGTPNSFWAYSSINDGYYKIKWQGEPDKCKLSFNIDKKINTVSI